VNNTELHAHNEGEFSGRFEFNLPGIHIEITDLEVDIPKGKVKASSLKADLTEAKIGAGHNIEHINSSVTPFNIPDVIASLVHMGSEIVDKVKELQEGAKDEAV